MKALAPLDLNSNKIENLSDPSSPQDAATKAYVDSVSGNGGSTIPTFIQETRPIASSPFIWWVTDSESNIIDLVIAM